jgi:hypothetical protein
MVWSRRDHRDYGTAVVIAGAVWFVIGVVLALVHDLSLADYLIKIFLPSAPAFLDSVDLARLHWRHASARQQVEHRIDDLWQASVSNPRAVRSMDCREIQDSAYLLRRDGPRVPTLFYKVRRATSDAATTAGAAALLGEARAGGPGG